MKTMINLLQLTVFLTKCYVLVIVSVKLNIYVNFQTIKSVINNYWPVLTRSQLLKLICFSLMCLLICLNIVEFMTVATASEYAIWEMHWGWTGRCLEGVCLPYSQQFDCSAYFPPNIFRSTVVATASQHALSQMPWWWSDDIAQVDIWRVACLPCNLATEPLLPNIG